ncbi:MAG: LPS-assembly protein LptD [Verrucomicrobia bacterium]|nr:LPS-assembly protein LptD [Verrucomicrobiota bacterium]
MSASGQGPVSSGAAKPLPQSAAAKPAVKIEVAEDGSLRMDEATRIAYADKDVVVTAGDVRLTADHLRYNTETRDVWAEGNVRLYSSGSQWMGESLYYNFDTQKTIFGKFRIFSYPWFVRGQEAEKVGPKYVIKDGFITTCDYPDPHWTFKAKAIEFHPDDKIVARGVTLRVGDVPVFYLPYISKSLKEKRSAFEFEPGMTSRFGAYLLTSYNWFVDPGLKGTVHADYRSKRGFATGADVKYRDPVFGHGDLRTYALYDNKPNSQSTTNPFEDVPKERYRVWWRDKTVLREDMMLKVDLKKQSDSRVIEDFYRGEYRREAQPISNIEVSKYDPGYMISALARPQMNSFYSTTERLPDLAIDIKRQQLFGSPVYYESELSVAHLSRKYSNILTNSLANLNDFNATRFDWLHQLSYPQMYFGWLSVVPRVGVRETWYGRSPTGYDTFGNYVDGGGPQTRMTFPMGLETSFKLSRVYDVNSDFWNVHGLRHIAQPVVDFTYVPQPNVPPSELYQFDTTGRYSRNMRTTRLLPNDFPAFDQIDAIDHMTTARAGVRNKLQTKRDGQTVDFVSLNTYGEFRASPYDGQRSLSDVYFELESQPLSWVAFDLDSRLSTKGELSELNAAIRFIKERQWEIAFARRYIKDNDFFYGGDSDFYVLSTHWVLTENWAVRTLHAFEADSTTLYEQEYQLIRDFHDWEASLRFRHQQNPGGSSEFEALVVFRLKAFPETSVDFGL